MLPMIDFPSVMWTSERTLRFAFQQEISQQNFLAVNQFNQFIQKIFRNNLIETVPGYFTVTAFLKKRLPIDIEQLESEWRKFQLALNDDISLTSRVVRIPVCYDEEFALDMERVMEFTKLSYEEIVSIHTSTPYAVHLIGFLPGFPYLGGLDPRLHVPRLQTPRKQIEASSVGIGGYQTGIYPIESPGGWNIIGRTPYKLFDVTRENPTLLQTGNRVAFYSITKQEFNKINQESV